MVFGCLILLWVLNGCATAERTDLDPTQYNPRTGYPAVGAGAPWHL